MTSYRSKVASVLVLLTTCVGQDNGSIDPVWAFSYIGTALNKAQASGSLSYWGYCDSNGGPADFPKLRIPRNKEASPLQTLREMFADDSKMRVTQEPGGTIRMAETDVPRDLLDLKISHLSFITKPPDGIKNPIQALWVILRAPEVKTFMTAQNIGPALPDFFFASFPIYRDSHISGELEDVSVEQALDYVLQTYPGFWGGHSQTLVTQECTEGKQTH